MALIALRISFSGKAGRLNGLVACSPDLCGDVRPGDLEHFANGCHREPPSATTVMRNRCFFWARGDVERFLQDLGLERLLTQLPMQFAIWFCSAR